MKTYAAKFSIQIINSSNHSSFTLTWLGAPKGKVGKVGYEVL